MKAFRAGRDLLYSDELLPFYAKGADEILPGFNVSTDDEIL